jgi:hypothetical protein
LSPAHAPAIAKIRHVFIKNSSTCMMWSRCCQ